MSVDKNYKQIFYSNLKGIKERISPPDYSTLESVREFATMLDRIEDRPIYILDHYTISFFFVSRRYLALLGYPDDVPVDFDFFLDASHPDDAKVSIDAPLQFFELLETLPPEEKFHYKLVTDFRLMMPTGEYTRVLEQIVVLKLDANHNPWLTLCITDLSTNQDIEQPSGAKIVHVESGETVGIIGNPDVFLEPTILTVREREILVLISKGYLSKQIAAMLGISINTINNHRRNIMQKTGCSNTFEAIKYVSSRFG